MQPKDAGVPGILRKALGIRQSSMSTTVAVGGFLKSHELQTWLVCPGARLSMSCIDLSKVNLKPDGVFKAAWLP